MLSQGTCQQKFIGQTQQMEELEKLVRSSIKYSSIYRNHKLKDSSEWKFTFNNLVDSSEFCFPGLAMFSFCTFDLHQSAPSHYYSTRIGISPGVNT